MSNVLVPSNTVIPIEVLPLVSSLDGKTAVTGSTSIKAKIRRQSDGYVLDWSDITFKAVGSVVQILEQLFEVDATNFPGEYNLSFDLASIVNLFPYDTYMITVVEDGTTDAANLPQVGQISVSAPLDDATFSRKMLKNKQTVAEGMNNNMVVYDDDGVTVLQRWHARNKNGGAILIDPAAPAIREPT